MLIPAADSAQLPIAEEGAELIQLALLSLKSGWNSMDMSAYFLYKTAAALNLYCRLIEFDAPNAGKAGYDEALQAPSMERNEQTRMPLKACPGVAEEAREILDRGCERCQA